MTINLLQEELVEAPNGGSSRCKGPEVGKRSLYPGNRRKMLWIERAGQWERMHPQGKELPCCFGEQGRCLSRRRKFNWLLCLERGASPANNLSTSHLAWGNSTF